MNCFEAGDWACAECGQHNYSVDEDCSNSRCKRQRDELDFDELPEVVTQRAATPWCISCRKLKAVCYKLNDWECPWCANHNYARKQVENGS